VWGKHDKLGERERKVRFGQDSLPNSHFCSGNERKVGTLFYPHPAGVGGWGSQISYGVSWPSLTLKG
jgi:hypothetical protein